MRGARKCFVAEFVCRARRVCVCAGVQACRWDTYRLAVRVSMTGGSDDEESIAKMLC